MAKLTSYTHAPIIILGGPTASGKSHLATVIAKKFDGVIINADAMQVYREIPIITAQPTEEDKKNIPHRLYGALPASEPCSAVKWLGMAKEAIDWVHGQGKVPIIVGGTGLYIHTLLEGLSPIPDIVPKLREEIRSQCKELGNAAFHTLLQQKDPTMAGRLNAGDTQRMVRAMEVIEQTGVSLAEWQQMPPVKNYDSACFFPIFIHPIREKLYAQCDGRFLSMLEQGALEEVRALAELSLDPSLPAMKALGVPELLAHLEGKYTREEAITKAQQSTRNYAKRQVTWFKHQLKGALEIEFGGIEEAEDQLMQQVSQFLLTH